MLKEYNREAYEATKNMLLEHRECCLVAATGIGKSNITTELIQELGLNALIIAPKASIRDEWTIMPDKYGIPPTFSTMTYQYFVRHYKKLYGFDAYIFDEAHHTGAPKWGKAIMEFKEGLDTEFVLGLTVDPNRYSDKIKRDKEGKIISSVIKTIFNDHSVYGHDLKSAIELGILPRATYVCSIYNADEKFDKYAAMDLTEELRGRLNYTRSNCEAIEDTLRKNVPNGVPVKGIVFVDSINNIDIGVRLARRAFPREAVHYIHSKLSAKENAETIEMFKKAKSGFIVSVDMIGEGLHIAGVNTVIMLRKTGSPSVYTQQIGRGLAADSKDAVIFDFVRNDTSIKKVLARIKNMEEYYEVEDDEEIDSEENVENDKGNRTRYPKISDQFIVKDKASDILEVFDAIDEYIKMRNTSQWTEDEKQIIRELYGTMGPNVHNLLPNRSKNACATYANKLGISPPIMIWTEEEDQILREKYPIIGTDAFKLLHNRTIYACLHRTKVLGLKNPIFWTEEEDQILKENYPIMGRKAFKLLPNRSEYSCQNRVRILGMRYNHRWSSAEDDILRNNYHLIGSECASLLENKTKKQIVERAKVLGLKYDDYWTEEEDQILKENYPIMGGDVYKLLPERTKNACYSRAANMKLIVDKNYWTEEEDQILKENYPIIGKKAFKLLPNRSMSACRNRVRLLSIKYDKNLK